MEKFIENGELVLNRNEDGYQKDETATVERITDIVAKELAPHMIERVAGLSKEVITCVRRSNELIALYIERFVLPAQSYLNLTNADRSSSTKTYRSRFFVCHGKYGNHYEVQR